VLSSISKLLSGSLIGVAALVAVAPARALPVSVTYNMQYSFFSPAAGKVVLQGPGTLTVQFSNGTAGGHVSAGALHVVSGTAMLTNNFTVLGGAIVFTGGQSDVFLGSGMGNVTAGGLFNLATVGHIASGFIHCGGAGFCGLAGFVTSVNNMLTSGPRTLNLNNPLNMLAGFPSLGPQTFMALGTGGMTPQGGVFSAMANGQEIGRQVVPEPTTGMLFGLGLVGFGIAASALRARARRA